MTARRQASRAINPTPTVDENTATKGYVGDITDMDLWNTWSDKSGVVSTMDSGQSVVHTYAPDSSAQLAVSGGMLTNPSTSGFSVGYDTVLVKDTSSPVLYLEFTYKFLDTGGSTEGALVMANLWQSAWAAGGLGAVVNDAPVHFLINGSAFALQTYDDSDGGAEIVDTAYSFDSVDGVERTVAIALDPPNNRAVVKCPDGKIRQFVDTSRSYFQDVPGYYAQVEVILNDGATDKKAGFTSWYASTVTDETDRRLVSRYYSLLRDYDVISTTQAAITAAVATKQDTDIDLSAIAVLTPTNDDIIQRKAGAWTSRSPSQYKTDLALTKSDVGLGSVDNLQQQPLDSDLTAIAALTPTDDDVLQRKAGGWTNRTVAQLKADLALNNVTNNAQYYPGGTDVAVADGGTGVSTLTGIVKGNGTSAFSAASAGTDYLAPGGALGTPSSGTLTNCTLGAVSRGTLASIPAASRAGNIYLASDTGGVYYDTGAAQVRHSFPGFPSYGVGPSDVPTTGWTSLNSPTTEAAYLDGRKLTVAYNATSQVRGAYRSLASGSSGSYTLETWVETMVPGVAGTMHGGIFLRQNSTQELILFGHGWTSEEFFIVMKYNSPTSFNSTPFAQQVYKYAYGIPKLLRFRDNGTTLFAEYSYDNDVWASPWSEARTTFLTADQWGYYGLANAASFTVTTNLRHVREY